MLAGEIPYDLTDPASQVIVRVVWEERIAQGIGGLDLEGDLRAAGRPWMEADEHGNVVWRRPGA